MSVERVELAPGLTVPRVISGLWQVADMERGGGSLDPVAAARALERHVEAGLDAFDMADHYGSAEEIAGRLRERSPGVALLTKWVPDPGEVTAEATREAVERALRRLRSPAVDLLQYHAWAYWHPAWLDGLFHLAVLRDEGLVRHLGLTNVDDAHLRVALASGVPVVTDQVCFSLLDRRPLDGLAELCAERGVGILAFGTLAGGFLTERWAGRPDPGEAGLTTWSQMKYYRFVREAGGWGALQELLGVVGRVAERRGASMAAVATRWVLDQPGVAAAIVGVRPGEREHVDDTLRVFDLRLDARDRADLHAAAAALGPIPGAPGDEYRAPPFLTASGDLSHHLDALPAPYPVAPGARPDRRRAESGTVWESLAGFARAVRVGGRILVSGTTATHGARLVGGDDPAAQAHACIDKLEGAIRSLGGRLEDVVRTRVYVRREEDWEAVSRAHGRRFGGIRPANTLVRAGLIGEGYLVEMEAEAVVGEEAPPA